MSKSMQPSPFTSPAAARRSAQSRFCRISTRARVDGVEISDVGHRLQTADARGKRAVAVLCGAAIVIADMSDHVRLVHME
jgi:hypothetical protein